MGFIMVRYLNFGGKFFPPWNGMEWNLFFKRGMEWNGMEKLCFLWNGMEWNLKFLICTPLALMKMSFNPNPNFHL